MTRSRGLLMLCFWCYSVLGNTGCICFEQVQHFAVRDPNTGAANYYRLQLKGFSGLAEYHMQAGYFSAAAVDVLRGQMPKIPELDLPVEREATFDRLLEHIDSMLLQEAKRVAPVNDPEALLNAATDRMYRAMREHAALAKQRGEVKGRLRAEEANRSSKKEAAQKAEAALAQLKQQADPNKADLEAAEKALATASLELKHAQRNEEDLTSALALLDMRLKVVEAMEKTANERMTKIIERFGDQTLGRDGDGGPPLSAEQLNEKYKQLARLVWFNSLSGSDVASIGMAENLSPFEFRKLVFWATATAIDLDEIAGEIDGIVDNVVKIGQSYKHIAKARKAEKAEQEQMQEKRVVAALEMLKETDSLSADQKARIEAVIKMLVPEVDIEPQGPSVPEPPR